MASIDRWDLNRRSGCLKMTGVVLKEDRPGVYWNVYCDGVDGNVFAVLALATMPAQYRTRDENGEHSLWRPRGHS